MAADAYQGHADDSSSQAASTNPDNVAPADRPDYDPSTVDPSVPGAGARAAGYPRH